MPASVSSWHDFKKAWIQCDDQAIRRHSGFSRFGPEGGVLIIPNALNVFSFCHLSVCFSLFYGSRP